MKSEGKHRSVEKTAVAEAAVAEASHKITGEEEALRRGRKVAVLQEDNPEAGITNNVAVAECSQGNLGNAAVAENKAERAAKDDANKSD